MTNGWAVSPRIAAPVDAAEHVRPEAVAGRPVIKAWRTDCAATLSSWLNRIRMQTSSDAEAAASAKARVSARCGTASKSQGLRDPGFMVDCFSEYEEAF